MSATPQDYQVGTAALATVIAAAIKDNVPAFLMGQVTERQSLIDLIEQQGAKAVIDAVDAARAKINQSK
jgi:dTDP-4-amino-4,6-dideoxygalactose transaminase